MYLTEVETPGNENTTESPSSDNHDQQVFSNLGLDPSTPQEPPSEAAVGFVAPPSYESTIAMGTIVIPEAKPLSEFQPREVSVIKVVIHH